MSALSSVPCQTRRTRTVCIRDTRNRPVKLPRGDVLIHAGDLTDQGSYSDSRAVQWLEKAVFEAKLTFQITKLLYDITLDYDFYSQRGSSFHNQDPQDPAKCLALFTSIHRLRFPYRPKHGTWASLYPRSQSAIELWAAVHLDADILVTHTPPYGHCDDSHGCRALRETLGRVRRWLHVCGHIHEARGAQRLRWDTDGLSIGDQVADCLLVDLTARCGSHPLDFHDAAPYPLGTDCKRRGQPNTTIRAGRRETCVVNSTTLATGQPHTGGKRFNKPIVVEIDLPIWN
ncbi:Metallo-dependent phosphatase [Parathielavia appendiculata]|uniref:Metallo-dependent phosphatase n=1 Tax=Parathielavia appendiculata TaxID=2587402 RepID=A0AAN6Z6Y1_9PEZI|nr:Metallo-dependent phosphatase [Parathielavia appendiculata]